MTALRKGDKKNARKTIRNVFIAFANSVDLSMCPVII